MTSSVEPAPQPVAPADEAGLVTVRVWELPVRVIHWTIFTCVVVLSITGFYIGNPVLASRGDTGFMMGNALAIHRAFAWIFTVSVVARIAWAFLGNRWARWDQFVPARRNRRALMRPTLEYYLFRRRDPPAVAGHNPLAGATYLIVYIMFVAQIFTGLALMSLADPGGWQNTVGGWVFDIWSIQGVRLFHHMVMWLTIGFTIHHVYSAVLWDYEERSGVLSSIFSSFKRLPPGHS